MNRSKVFASTLAAIVALSGIGSILIANHAPQSVDAVELSSQRDGPPVADELDPAILRRDDAAQDGIETVDDDGDDSNDGASDSAATDSVSASVSAQGSVSADSADSVSAVQAKPAATTKPAATKAPAPSVSASVSAASAPSADSDSVSSDD